MKENNLSVFYRFFNIILSISIIAAGLCLIYGSLSIYYSGPDPYSRQAVSDAFSIISVPVYICLGLIALSIVFYLLLPALSTKQKPKTNYENRLKLLLSKKDMTALTNEQSAAAEKERKIRKLIKVINCTVIVLSSIVFLAYAIDGKHFDSTEINSSVIKAMWVLLPCLGVMLAVSLTAEILSAKSFNREIGLLTKLPNLKQNPNTDTPTESKADKKLAVIRCTVLLVGLGLLIYGFATGGVADVLTKAVNICTECIGLG
ncbi:MAG: hypothetical protein IJ451_02365 [Ruminococcus sp.]|nr:hypothetical protein [Ruminococcus sp.]